MSSLPTFFLTWWPSRVALEQLDAYIKQSIMCDCSKLSMLSLGNCSELTKARSPKTADATREVVGNSLKDSCIPVSHLCSTYRRENVPNWHPDALGCFHVIVKSVHYKFCSVLGNTVNSSAPNKARVD